MTLRPLRHPRFSVRPVTPTDTLAFHSYRYTGALSIYDVHEDLTANSGYLAVEDASDGTLAGFACIGEEGLVESQVTDPTHVPLGVGMHPDLVGRGLGKHFLAAVIDHACEASIVAEDATFVAAILDWNAASLAVVKSLGFEVVGEIVNSLGRFVIAELPVHRALALQESRRDL